MHQLPVQLNVLSASYSPIPPGFNVKRHFSLSLPKFDDLFMSNNQAPHDTAHPVFKMLRHLFNETKICTRNTHSNAAGLTKICIHPEKTKKMCGSNGNMFPPLEK